MKELKIMYCKDSNDDVIFYNDTVKGEVYYCIDCGKELIVKDGNINRKHLAHKETCGCKGTGESIFHKHWKEKLFSKGMTIMAKNRVCEILDIKTEVELSDYFNKEWDRKIIVDVLLETDKGIIIVEIHYKNKKDWTEYMPYYDTIDNIFEIFELKVSTCVNEPPEWNVAQNIFNKQSSPVALYVDFYSTYIYSKIYNDENILRGLLYNKYTGKKYSDVVLEIDKSYKDYIPKEWELISPFLKMDFLILANSMIYDRIEFHKDGLIGGQSYNLIDSIKNIGGKYNPKNISWTIDKSLLKYLKIQVVVKFYSYNDKPFKEKTYKYDENRKLEFETIERKFLS